MDRCDLHWGRRLPRVLDRSIGFSHLFCVISSVSFCRFYVSVSIQSIYSCMIKVHVHASCCCLHITRARFSRFATYGQLAETSNILLILTKNDYFQTMTHMVLHLCIITHHYLKHFESLCNIMTLPACNVIICSAVVCSTICSLMAVR